MPIYCIAGLGNPGPEYASTRHNVGFRVADRLAEDHGTHIRRSEFGALTATIMVGRTEVLVMKPQLYMNRSGRCVAAAMESIVDIKETVQRNITELNVIDGASKVEHCPLEERHYRVQQSFDFVGDVQPIFERKCVACHAC